VSGAVWGFGSALDRSSEESPVGVIPVMLIQINQSVRFDIF